MKRAFVVEVENGHRTVFLSDGDKETVFHLALGLGLVVKQVTEVGEVFIEQSGEGITTFGNFSKEIKKASE